MNVFIKIFGVKQPMDVVKADLLKPVVRDQLQNEEIKSWKVLGFVGDFVLHHMFNQIKCKLSEKQPDDVLVDCNIDDDLKDDKIKFKARLA